MPSPSLQIWNRLEPRPRAASFTRSLRAEVRDALWMLTRQWQLGEWNAEDTGTAAFAQLDMQTSRVNRMAKKNSNAFPVDGMLPMECLAEREPVSPDLVLRIDLGRQFLKILRHRLTGVQGVTQNNIAAIETSLRQVTSLHFSVPASPPSLNAATVSNPALWQTTLAAGEGRAIDGYKLLEYLWTGSNTVATLIAVSPPAAVSPAIAAGNEFKAWYAKVYAQPSSPAENYWQKERMEYQFACSAPRTTTDYTVLTADEYYHGHLDWFSFDIQPVHTDFQSLVAGPPDTSLLQGAPFTVIPSKVMFGGMPAPRWWEMEDRRIDFGGLDVSTTDLARLLTGEFATLYSNDWTLLPYTVPAGTICNLRRIIVTDVFGQATWVQPAGEGYVDDWERWNMFTLTSKGTGAADTRLFVPPVTGDLQESEPLENVNFMRDEMANMIWAVETIVPDDVSKGEHGTEAARRLKQYLESQAGSGNVIYPLPNEAEITYNVMSTVPENWIPFVPVRLSPNAPVMLQRAAMPRLLNNLPPAERVRPRTTLLQYGANLQTNVWSPYYVHEEEVPRSGAILSRTWQRARLHDGRVALWLGRRKQNGRGEGNSGLRFDYLGMK